MSTLWTKVRSADPEYKKKLQHTLCVYFCYMAVGLSTSQTGPALLDLQLITNTDTEQASLFITGTSIGSIIGSVAIGFIFGRWNKALMMSLMSLGIATTVIVLPWCASYGVMIAMHVLVAVFISAFGTAVIVDVIRTWAPDSRVYIQIQSTCFSVGGALAPLITQPFLAPRSAARINGTFENTSTTRDTYPLINDDLQNSTGSANRSECDGITTCEESNETSVQFAYLVTGVWFVVGSCLFLVEYIYRDEEKSSTVSNDQSESIGHNLSRPVFLTTITFLFLMFFFFVSIHISLASYLFTFAVTYLDWTKRNGANLTTDYWLCHACGRLVAIFFTKFVSPFRFLFFSTCIILVAATGNVFFSLYQYDIGVWVCTGVIGLCVSSQVPSLMMWTEESILRLTPRIMSILNLAITFPGMVIPQTLGYLMQEVSPVWLFYLNLIQCGVLVINLLSVYAWTNVVIRPTRKDVTNTDV